MHDMVQQCRAERQRMKSRLGVNAPLRGWTVVHAAPLRLRQLSNEYSKNIGMSDGRKTGA